MSNVHHHLDFQSFLSENDTIKTAFLAVSHSRTFPKGSVILGQDDMGQDIFLLGRGHAKVVVYSEAGNEVHLAEFAAGALFGEMAALLGSARTSSVIAQTGCTLNIISARDFEALMHSHPSLAVFMTRMMAKRVQDTSQSLFESLAFTVPQRIYEELLRRSEKHISESEIHYVTPAPSVTSLSETINVSREAASRAISKLITQGLVKKEKSRWTILKPCFDSY